MLKVKCANFIKRFLITVLGFLMLALVESAPDFPIFYAVIVITCGCSIKLLWESILRDEKKIKGRGCFQISQRIDREDHRGKAA